ncbi:MAG: 30S ribosomal protein S15 [Rickettsiales bacterium]|nr:30S ribosomal protein S15 [Rickettsiales bacterium]
MSILGDRKSELIKNFSENEKDKGSTNIQVAILTERINNLTNHLKNNKKDQSTRRGLLKLVGRRKKLLSYLRKRNTDKYKDLIKSLGLRH